MTPQERDVIAGIFDRLKQAADQPRDPEAEAFIAQRLRDQPYAPYAMAQAVYVQEQALTNMQAQVEELQGRLRDLETRQTEAPPQSGGFLSGIFGGTPPAQTRSVPSFPQRSDAAPSGAWNRQQAVPSAPGQGEPAGPGAGPWANQAAGRGGGFMATALTTAAGVAGGMMLGNVLTNAFGGDKAQAADGKASEAATTSAAQDSTAAAQNASDSTSYNDGSSDPANYQNATHQEPPDDGYDDGSSFDGGDDEGWL